MYYNEQDHPENKIQYLTQVNYSAQFLDNRDHILNRCLILVYIEPLGHLKVHRVVWRVLSLVEESLIANAHTHVAGTARAYDAYGFLEIWKEICAVKKKNYTIRQKKV